MTTPGNTPPEAFPQGQGEGLPASGPEAPGTSSKDRKSVV